MNAPGDAIATIANDIYALEPTFDRVSVDRTLSFAREAEFAIQTLSKNDYALSVAMKNRQSVVDAVTNIAAIGISLNPARRQAYLVPRDGRICLDISYIGLLDIAMESGSIRWGQARLVHAQDTFEMQGLDQQPIHRFNPFDDRGGVLGAYCVVKTADGDYLTEVMSIADIQAIRDRSPAWIAFRAGKTKSCPWDSDAGEMGKKTVVKRAYKYWPKTERLAKAIHYVNTENDEGLPEIENPPLDGAEIVMPRSRSKSEADTPAAPLENEPPRKEEPTPQASSDDLATPGERAFLTKKLGNRLREACAAKGIQNFDALTKDGFTALRDWMKENR